MSNIKLFKTSFYIRYALVIKINLTTNSADYILVNSEERFINLGSDEIALVITF